jgi:hypothetical protein
MHGSRWSFECSGRVQHCRHHRFKDAAVAPGARSRIVEVEEGAVFTADCEVGQSRGVAERRRAHEKGIDYRKHRGRDANREREKKDGSGRCAGLPN